MTFEKHNSDVIVVCISYLCVRETYGWMMTLSRRIPHVVSWLAADPSPSHLKSLFLKGIQKWEQFEYEVLVICETAPLWTLRPLHAELNVGALWRSRYVQWGSCNQSKTMSAVLSDCTTVELRGFIQYLRSAAVKPTEILRRTLARLCENCITQRKL